MTGPKRFRKRPVVVEAMQWDGSTRSSLQLQKFVGAALVHHGFYAVHTLEGDMKISLNDWVVCGVSGEFYPVRDDIFLLTYEVAE